MKKIIAKIIKKQINLDEEKIKNLIEIPPETKLGDYSFPCFSLAKIYKQNPNKIALELGEKLKLGKEVQKIQVVGPYINFFLNRQNLAEETIRKIIKEKQEYGKGKSKEKILIEHTSINPNASPHVGRIRNALIGDSLTRIYRFLGYDVETHYYVNDVSKQIAMLTLVCTGKEKFEDLLNKYIKISKKIKENPDLENQVFSILNKFESGDSEIAKKFKKIVNIAIKGQKQILKKLGIEFDYFDPESKFLKKQTEILKRLNKTGKLYKDKLGRAVLDQRNTNLDKEMRTAVFVLTRKDGTGLYPLRDIAYTEYKSKRAKKNIIILGEDQKLYFKQLSNALRLLKITPPKSIHYSFITLKTEKGNKKMSTRKGDVVLVEDFLKQAEDKAEQEIKKRKTKGSPDKVAVAAIKYSILRSGNNTPITFSLDEAISFEGDTGPYLQYSYARASSILRKAKNKEFELIMPESRFISDIEFNLIKSLSNFPSIVRDTLNQDNPSLLTHYTLNLCKLFNEFYHKSKVINSEYESFRVLLTASFREIIKLSLNLLGIEVMEEM